MAKIICDVFMYIFEAILLYYYAEGLFTARSRRSVRILVIAIINIGLLIIYQAENTILNGLLQFACNYFVFRVLYKTQIKTAFFHVIMFISVMAISEIAVINSCAVIFNDFDAMATDLDAYIFVITTSKLIYFIIMLVIRRLCSVKQYENQKDSFYWLLFIFPLICVPVCLMIFFVADNIEVMLTLRIVMSSIFIVLLFSNLIIFFIYDRANKNKAELYELKAASLQQETDEKYFDAIEQSQEEIRRFSHDMKNHLLQIRYLEDIDEIHKYLDEIIKDVEKISYVRISSNKMLNLIVSKYSAICEKKRIKFDVQVKLASLNYVKDVDLSAILNNLLDNAVEAAELCENGCVEMSIFSKNNNFDGIIIKNSCEREPEHINGRLITSKKDKFFHGLGVTIVNRVLKKYDAISDWQYFKEKKMFETSVVFPKGDILKRNSQNS